MVNSKRQTPPKPTKSTAPQPSSGATRRWSQAAGSSVVIAAAVSIVLALNVVVFWQYDMLGPNAKAYVRYDVTQTRRHTLSPQTRAVLSGLGHNHRLTALLEASQPGREGIQDLLEEYARRSPLLTLDVMDAAAPPTRKDRLLREITSAYDTAPAAQAASQTADRLAALAAAFDAYQSELTALSQEAEVNQQLTAPLLTHAQSSSEHLATVLASLQQLETEVMPAFSPTLTQALERIEQVAGPIRDVDALLYSLSRSLRAQPELQEQALAVNEKLQQLKPALSELVTTLREHPVPPERYEQARRTLLESEWVLVSREGMGPSDVSQFRVIPVSAMFRKASATADRQEGETQAAQTLFLGEEQVTGALVSLGLEQPPMVVFVRGDFNRPLAGPGGDGLFDHVAQRLTALNIDVRAWNPAPAQAGTQALPPPEPAPGQRVVWVAMPFRAPTDRVPETLNMAPRQRVASFLKDRLDQGDGVMVILNYDPTWAPQRLAAVRGDAAPSTNGSTTQSADPTGPLITLLRTFGLHPLAYRRLAQQTSTPQGQWIKTDRFDLSGPGSDHPIAAATRGLDFRLQLPMPIEFEAQVGSETFPLLRVAGPRVWSFVPPPNTPPGRIPPFDPNAAAPSVVVAAAAETDTQRLVVLGEPLFTTDLITTLGRHPELGTGPGLADRPGGQPLYPGNAELFVNSIFWLARLDGLIVASPRSQALPRIQPLTDTYRRGVQLALALGMPASILVLGMLVGWRRRR